MSPLSISVGELILRMDTDLPEASNLEKISEAQSRAHTLAALGDQLVGHYVTQAREDGASWSDIGDAIGVSKQAAQQRHAPNALFSRFTDRARHAIVLAQEVARNHSHDYIGSEHLLLGLLEETNGLASKILVDKAGSVDAVRAAVAEVMPAPGKKSPRGHIPFTPKAKRGLELAIEESAALGHDFIGTEHVLLGVSAVGEGIAVDALRALDFDHDALRETIRLRIEQLMRRDPRETSD